MERRFERKGFDVYLKAKRKEVVRTDFPKNELSFSKEEFKDYLKATSLGPTTGKVKGLASEITKGKKPI